MHGINLTSYKLVTDKGSLFAQGLVSDYVGLPGQGSDPNRLPNLIGGSQPLTTLANNTATRSSGTLYGTIYYPPGSDPVGSASGWNPGITGFAPYTFLAVYTQILTGDSGGWHIGFGNSNYSANVVVFTSTTVQVNISFGTGISINTTLTAGESRQVNVIAVTSRSPTSHTVVARRPNVPGNRTLVVRSTSSVNSLASANGLRLYAGHSPTLATRRVPISMYRHAVWNRAMTDRELFALVSNPFLGTMQESVPEDNFWLGSVIVPPAPTLLRRPRAFLIGG